MKIEIYPYGPDVQRHYEDLRARGAPDHEASESSRSYVAHWPDEFRLPVAGDSVSVGWASGVVTSVWFGFDDDGGGWDVRVHLGVR